METLPEMEGGEDGIVKHLLPPKGLLHEIVFEQKLKIFYTLPKTFAPHKE